MKKKGISILTCIVFLNAIPAFSQYGAQVLPGFDTLYIPRSVTRITIDPDPLNNPFITDSAQSFGRIVANDDPGGPGSGGFDPPDDAAIPLDGGVSVLILAGALIGLKKNRKEKISS